MLFRKLNPIDDGFYFLDIYQAQYMNHVYAQNSIHPETTADGMDADEKHQNLPAEPHMEDTNMPLADGENGDVSNVSSKDGETSMEE